MKNFVFFPSISLSHIGSAAFETRLDRGHLPTIQFFPTWGHDKIFSNQNSKRIMKRVQRAAQTNVCAMVWPRTEKTGLFRCATWLPN